MAKICLIFLEQDNITRNRFANYSKSTCSPINIPRNHCLFYFKMFYSDLLPG